MDFLAFKWAPYLLMHQVLLDMIEGYSMMNVTWGAIQIHNVAMIWTDQVMMKVTADIMICYSYLYFDVGLPPGYHDILSWLSRTQRADISVKIKSHSMEIRSQFKLDTKLYKWHFKSITNKQTTMKVYTGKIIKHQS